MELNGNCGELTYVDPKTVKVDPYQRRLEADRVERIAKAFNARLFDPVVLSKRKAGYFVVDGQHRVRAAQAAKITKIPARVLEGLSREDEANLFVDAQLSRKPIHSLDRFNAKVIAGDPSYTTVNKILKDAGFTLGHHSQTNVPGRLRCITLLMTIYQGRGKEHFARMTAVLKGLSNDRETAHLNDAFIRPLSTMLYKSGDKINTAHFIEVFKKVSIEKLVWRAIRQSKVRGGRCVDKMIAQLQKVYNASAPPRQIRLKAAKKPTRKAVATLSAP